MGGRTLREASGWPENRRECPGRLGYRVEPQRLLTGVLVTLRAIYQAHPQPRAAEGSSRAARAAPV